MRRSRWLVFGLAGLLVLAGLVVAADRIGSRLATAQLRNRVAAATGSAPEVTTPGPFLPQAVRREFRSVDLALPSLRLEQADLRVNDVRARLQDVPWASTGRIGAVDMTGTVPFSELERRAGLAAGSVSAAGDRQVRIRQNLALFGLSVGVAATADLRLDGDALAVEPSGLEIAGSQVPLDDALRSRLTEQLRARVPLTGLPAGTRVQDVTVGQDGLHVHLIGRDVALADLRGAS